MTSTQRFRRYANWMKGRPHIDGHALKNRHITSLITAVCKCGARSDKPLSYHRRVQWQNKHLTQVMFQRNNPGDVGVAIVRMTGITYRQLDHWARKGYLPNHSQGSGTSRHWSADAPFIAAEMVRLIGIGFTPEAAAQIARRVVEEPSLEDRYHVGNGVEIQLTNWDAARAARKKTAA
ncbi:hypothetical protein DEI97_013460 [Curtobacterium sp. MCLR17_032]|uniref:MerR family transcriptional regulator n=1 Tax=Curtobacterium sp. MCLR17_032 TaxID=2175650 RepID=UPI0011B414CE|nr:MerR family transcriptional regulator [Curtobacterium sp. MCLR17_032]WIE60748.1 hypothetical protein DEI97_013460 [Curtobacterium sp. MCLR17_032]